MAGSGSNRWEQVRARATGTLKVNTGIKRSMGRRQPRRRVGTGDSRQIRKCRVVFSDPTVHFLRHERVTNAGVCRKAWVSYVGGPPTSQFVKMAEAGQVLVFLSNESVQFLRRTSRNGAVVQELIKSVHYFSPAARESFVRLCACVFVHATWMGVRFCLHQVACMSPNQSVGYLDASPPAFVNACVRQYVLLLADTSTHKWQANPTVSLSL